LVIRVPRASEEARQAQEQRRQREAEEAAERCREVQDAIAKGDLLRMAALWLDRNRHLSGKRCAESVRDLKLLTPELLHAAADLGLPCPYLLPVRSLEGSSWLFRQMEMIRLLTGAAMEVETLRFAVEAKQRAAKKVVQTPPLAVDPPAPGQPGQSVAVAATATPPESTRISAACLVAIQQIANETGIPYSTLTSRRLRLAEGERPAPVATDDKQRDLYRRGDWDKIIDAVKKSVGERSAPDGRTPIA
jgi:hypothetical protein